MKLVLRRQILIGSQKQKSTNSLLGIQHTHDSNFNNFQSVLQFHRFTKAANIFENFFAKMTNAGNVHSKVDAVGY